MPNWTTARFDGSHHLRECTAEDCGGKCSAAMALYWRDAQAPVDADRVATRPDGVPITMAELMGVR